MEQVIHEIRLLGHGLLLPEHICSSLLCCPLSIRSLLLGRCSVAAGLLLIPKLFVWCGLGWLLCRRIDSHSCCRFLRLFVCSMFLWLFLLLYLLCIWLSCDSTGARPDWKFLGGGLLSMGLPGVVRLLLLLLLFVRKVSLVALQLLHPEPHNVLHFVEHLQIDIFVRFFRINLIQYALLTNMLPTLQLKEFGLSAAFTYIDRIVVCVCTSRSCSSTLASLLRWLLWSHSRGLWRLFFLRNCWSRDRGKHLSKRTSLLEILRELSRLPSLALGNILFFFGRRIIQSVSWLFLNRFDAKVFDKALHTLKPFMQLVALW